MTLAQGGIEQGTGCWDPFESHCLGRHKSGVVVEVQLEAVVSKERNPPRLRSDVDVGRFGEVVRCRGEEDVGRAAADVRDCLAAVDLSEMLEHLDADHEIKSPIERLCSRCEPAEAADIR